MQPGLISVLSQKLFPVLQLSSLYAIRGTCTDLRAAVAGTKASTWLQITRYDVHLADISTYMSFAPEPRPSAGTLCHLVTLCVQLVKMVSLHTRISSPGSTTAYDPAAVPMPPDSGFGAQATQTA